MYQTAQLRLDQAPGWPTGLKKPSTRDVQMYLCQIAGLKNQHVIYKQERTGHIRPLMDLYVRVPPLPDQFAYVTRKTTMLQNLPLEIPQDRWDQRPIIGT